MILSVKKKMTKMLLPPPTLYLDICPSNEKEKNSAAKLQQEALKNLFDVKKKDIYFKIRNGDTKATTLLLLQL
jgi:hypothetical protein